MQNSTSTDSVRIHASTIITLVLAVYIVPLRWLCAWFVSVAVHEFGHFLAVEFFGGTVMTLSMGQRGCVMEAADLTFLQQVICIAAGPAAGFVLSTYCSIFPRIATCALIHSVFNLLPFYPLDGGRICRLLVNKYRKTKIPCKPPCWRVQ